MGPKMKGIGKFTRKLLCQPSPGDCSSSVAQSVKEVLDSLVSDNLVICEKIGTSNYYWSFPSTALVTVCRHLRVSCLNWSVGVFQRQTKLAQLQEERDRLKEQIAETEQRIHEGTAGREDTVCLCCCLRTRGIDAFHVDGSRAIVGNISSSWKVASWPFGGIANVQGQWSSDVKGQGYVVSPVHRTSTSLRMTHVEKAAKVAKQAANRWTGMFYASSWCSMQCEMITNRQCLLHSIVLRTKLWDWCRDVCPTVRCQTWLWHIALTSIRRLRCTNLCFTFIHASKIIRSHSFYLLLLVRVVEKEQ